MKKIMLLQFIVLLLTTLTFAKQTEDASCRLTIPFNFPAGSNVAGVSELHFVARPPSTSADFWFTNRSQKDIVSVLSIVELRDANGQRMFNMLFHAFEFKEHKKDESPSSPERQAQEAIQLDQPVAPGQKVLWGMTSPYFVTSCPASAAATFLQIQFRDGSPIEHWDEGFHRDAVALDVAGIDLESAPFSSPFQALASLSIDPQGSASVTDVGSAPAQFKDWLDVKIKEWRFAPAYEGFTPISGQLHILFRFHGDKPPQYPPLKNLPKLAVFQVADVFPPEPDKRISRVYLGLSTFSVRGKADF